MIDLINPLHSSWSTWFITFFCAFICGLSKGGLKGFAMINIPILAYLYGGMPSVGILLPFLVFGDFFALLIYWRSIRWKYVKHLLPFALIGLVLATFTGKYISDSQFKTAIAIAILTCLGLIIYKDIVKSEGGFMKKKWFSASLGISGGFATMIGNAAGPIFNLYLMTMNLPKTTFIATGAIFYFILNVIKLPIYTFYWHSINWQTFHLNLVMLPILLLGIFIGKYLVKLIPESIYRKFVIIIIGLSAILLFF